MSERVGAATLAAIVATVLAAAPARDAAAEGLARVAAALMPAPAAAGDESASGIGYGGFRGRPAGAFAVAAAADRSDTGADAGSAPPATARRSWLGIAVGRSSYRGLCDAAAPPCDHAAVGARLTAGMRFGAGWGAELGYVDTGSVDLAAGHARAQGVGFSLLLIVPLGSFHVFARAGATWGRSRVTAVAAADPVAQRLRALSARPAADALSAGVGGSASGWGGSYGVGVAWDLAPASALVLRWDRDDFRFPGAGRQDVSAASLGYVHRY